MSCLFEYGNMPFQWNGCYLVSGPCPQSQVSMFVIIFERYSFKPPLNVVAHGDMNLVAISHMFRLPFKNTLKWPKWHFHKGSNFTDSGYSVFVDKFLHSTHVFNCFASSWMFWAFSIFNIGHTTFEVGKPLKNLCSSHCPLSKTYFQHFKGFCSIFPSLTQNLM
jgi:hypothetical protein